MGNSTSCTSSTDVVSSPFSIVLIVLSVCILVVLSFTSQRRRLLKDGGICLWGYPGIVTPVNFLSQHYQPDYIYLVLFGTISGDVFKYILIAHSYFISPTSNIYFNVVISSVISPLLLVLYLSVKYFPLFACIDPPIKVLGHLMGTLYSAFLISYGVYEDVSLSYCHAHGNNTVLWLLVSVRLPVYILNLITFIWYCVSLLLNCVKLWRRGCYKTSSLSVSGTKEDNANNYYKYYYNYVRHTLRKKSDVQHGKLYFLVTCAFKYVFPCILSARKLPLWFLGALSVAVMVLFQFAFILVAVIIYAVAMFQCDRICPSRNCGWYCGDVYNFIYPRLAAALICSPLISLLMCIVLIAHMIIAVHNSILSAARGNYKFSKQSPSFRVSASLKYAGYQIAFVLAGYIIYMIIILLFGTLILGILVLFKWYPDNAKYLVTYITVPVIWTGIVVFSETILCKLLFVRKGGGKFLIITNQRIFHWFSYILLIYNAIIGLVIALLRILISLFFNLLLIMRLDRVVLMRGFEACDIAHNAYLGFLFLDYTYNNAIVQTFVKLLCDSVREKEKSVKDTALLSFRDFNTEEFVEHNDLSFGTDSLVNNDKVVHYGASIVNPDMKSRISSRQSRNRWFVAYTLVRNPSLQPLTASNLHCDSDSC